MRLTEVRVKLCNGQAGRLKAYCSLTFDDAFVVRDVKLIEGHDGLFLAMPARKLCDRCPHCGEKNHLRAKYCSNCGTRLDDNRYLRYQNGNGGQRYKLHADIAHPIRASCREEIEREVIRAYYAELEKSKQPGYVPPDLDDEDADGYDWTVPRGLKPTGTS